MPVEVRERLGSKMVAVAVVDGACRQDALSKRYRKLEGNIASILVLLQKIGSSLDSNGASANNLAERKRNANAIGLDYTPLTS